MIDDIRAAFARLIESIDAIDRTIHANVDPKKVNKDYNFAEIDVSQDDVEYYAGSRRISYAVSLSIFTGKSDRDREQLSKDAEAYYDSFETQLNNNRSLGLRNSWVVINSADFDIQTVNEVNVQMIQIECTVFNNRIRGE